MLVVKSTPPSVALLPRRLAVAGAVAGFVIAQVTGLVVWLLLRATNGAFNRVPALVALLIGLALGAVTGRILCRLQGRSWRDPGPRHSYALAIATFAGLAAGEGLRWALVRPWEAAIKETDYFFLALAALAGAGWQVWFTVTFEMEEGG